MITCLEKLELLRSGMRKNGIGVYIIPSTDPHLGEYIPGHWKIIPWLTGFTGSAATVVVTYSFAGLWTDSRYFLQAEEQLEGSGYKLMKLSVAHTWQFIDWMTENITPGTVIGFDGRIFSKAFLDRLRKAVKIHGVSFNTELDLISDIWNDRPPMPFAQAFDHDVVFCGKTREQKIEEVRRRMREKNVGYHLLTSNDDIMWLLNIRGNDVGYNPLVTSFAVVGIDQVLLFADENKIPRKLASDLDKAEVVILPYEETAAIISSLPAGSSILITPGTVSVSLFNALPPGMNVVEDISIPAGLKSIKNSTEIENLRMVMVKDGVALTRFYFWLEKNAGAAGITEITIADKLLEFRSMQEHNVGASFSTIAAVDEHGALPHYSATAGSESIIGSKGILLIDSGGQYLDGTTDITRTIALGEPSQRQIKDFTLVLKGTIGLARAHFPEGTMGIQLDILARRALWEERIDYGHGTGHGVGFFLNVHEGPQSISQSAGPGTATVIRPGMLISDEPAVYREGEYGIRTENLILCVDDEVTSYGKFLKFETMSLCYIDLSLIDPGLLNREEIEWLNAYHADVFMKLGPYLKEEERSWLMDKTRPLH
jgi:Xaa-Pro aminopeptidase